MSVGSLSHGAFHVSECFAMWFVTDVFGIGVIHNKKRKLFRADTCRWYAVLVPAHHSTLLPLLRIGPLCSLLYLGYIASIEAKQGSSNKSHFPLTDSVYCTIIFVSGEKERRTFICACWKPAKQPSKYIFLMLIIQSTTTAHTTRIQHGSELGLSV